MPVALGLQCGHPPSVSSHISPKWCPVLQGLGDRTKSKNKGASPVLPSQVPTLGGQARLPP